MHLNKSKLFITLILEYFAKKTDIMILIIMQLNPIDQRCCPLYNKSLEPILLVEVSVHVLLHGLDWKPRITAFGVVFHFV